MFADFVNDCKATRLALGLGVRAKVEGVGAKTMNGFPLKLPLESAPKLTASA